MHLTYPMQRLYSDYALNLINFEQYLKGVEYLNSLKNKKQKYQIKG
ncbi:hypothetical protein BRE01_62480 [Brevibacillus reuszeri]|uniref:Uncharacterized protein n=1 Tax=Brevibacillus reuszeri TaxID=54915 RepID=A0ABQ0TXD7_9BACL|nr:hypothetical protein BRE01_62480 [Brevibacillus reuszeri]